MFGYVRPSLKRLSAEDELRFRAMYCGLCRTLGERCGLAARFILNYDFTFLALLLDDGDCEEPVYSRCIAHPFSRRGSIPPTPAMELAADCSVILAWWQIQDALADERGSHRAKYAAAAAALGPAYRRAAAARENFDRATRQHLADLRQLEAEKCPSIDRAADTFAALLRDIGREVGDSVKARVLEQLLYHLGRWIYLVDAADDLEGDYASGSYNPLIYRFSLEEGRLTAEAKEALVISLDHSVRLMAAAFELWDFGVWSDLIRSVGYEGLFCVGGAVLEGTYHANDMPFSFEGEAKESL